MEERDTGKLASVNRAFDVLETFTPAAPEWGLSALSRELDVGKPTLHRVLKTLTARGYLRQDPDSRVYRLGFRLLQIGQAALVDTPSQAAQRHLRSLAHQVGEQATLWVLDGDHAVCVLKVAGQRALRTHTELGAREPATLLASGRCLLAHLPPGELERLLGDEASAIQTSLSRIRRVGYAVSHGDRWPDVSAVGAPVFDESGSIVAAIAVSSPTSRFDDATFDRAATAVIAAAEGASLDLGAPPSDRRDAAPAAPRAPRSRTRSASR